MKRRSLYKEHFRLSGQTGQRPWNGNNLACSWNTNEMSIAEALLWMQGRRAWNKAGSSWQEQTWRDVWALVRNLVGGHWGMVSKKGRGWSSSLSHPNTSWRKCCYPHFSDGKSESREEEIKLAYGHRSDLWVGVWAQSYLVFHEPLHQATVTSFPWHPILSLLN